MHNSNRIIFIELAYKNNSFIKMFTQVKCMQLDESFPGNSQYLIISGKFSEIFSVFIAINTMHCIIKPNFDSSSSCFAFIFLLNFLDRISCENISDRISSLYIKLTKIEIEFYFLKMWFILVNYGYFFRFSVGIHTQIMNFSSFISSC